ncbi:hypothetical protein [Gallibacterium sp. AGMB14963]|uniref:hypothetical protein n=1 Tax=Gallibacterium faecale TaxID=3019086 RepID=UPI0022F1747C|nr:hypothetical protein [Gallibacterium sp. AGMB14963]MDA3978984.1 hypothetical protein [Gallibacterium sp. AGMB14963]
MSDMLKAVIAGTLILSIGAIAAAGIIVMNSPYQHCYRTLKQQETRSDEYIIKLCNGNIQFINNTSTINSNVKQSTKQLNYTETKGTNFLMYNP